MAIEIERKYLLKDDSWRKLAAKGSVYCQGYMATKNVQKPRVRLAGNTGYLTIKGAIVGCSRFEFEYTIPINDAKEILHNLCEKPLIEKIRYKVEWGDLTWEIDEFDGENKGLILAEVELKDENQTIELPPWIGKEVSDNPKYYNFNLVKHPFTRW